MNTIVDNLSQVQQEAVTFNSGPLLILAGAGSGKTRILTHRAAWLIEQGVNPENILLQTFTNKAAGEMKERISRLLGNWAHGHLGNPESLIAKRPNSLPVASTFHSFCARVLRRDGKFLGIPNSFVIYDDDDGKEAIKQILKKLNFNSESIKPHSFLANISVLKNELIDPGEYESMATGEWQKKAALVYRLYQKFLGESAAVDFDDLLLLTVKLLENYPEVLAKYQNTYQYLLVDEWQDTNKAQYQITKLLAGKSKNITAVGDASQSVYSWRGADHKNIDYLTRDFPDITIINLEQNYRSTQTILDVAYSVISKNRSHPILKLWTENGNGQKITLYQARNEHDEASFVVSEIQRLTAYRLPAKQKSVDHRQLATQYRDFAILYRTNAQSRVLEEAMLHAGIPYTIFGSVKFYARREIKDVLSYLRLVTNDKEPISRARAEKLGKGRLQKFTKKLEFLKTIEEQQTLEILDAVLEATSYLDLYDPEDPEDLARLENIKELRSVASEFPNLIDFLEQIALVENAQTEKGVSKLTHSEADSQTEIPSNQGVTLMTAHAAKGLEFPVVFIVGLEEGLFPHSRSQDDKEELEEERRLLYVGITRAKQKLYLSFATRRLIFGQRARSAPSRFLADIPENLIEGSESFSPKESWS